MNRKLDLPRRIGLALHGDAEFHGAAVRLGVGVGVSLVLTIGMVVGKFSLPWHTFYAFFSYFFVLALVLAADILWRPGRTWRVYFGVLFDITTTTIAVSLTGPLHSVLFPLYIWIVITNGVRFGWGPMASAAAVATVMFNGQLMLHGLWVSHVLDACVYSLFLVLFPSYFTRMIRALHQARRDAESANRAKSDFLANMTHELRTPLVGVTALSSLLATTPLSREQLGYVMTLQSSARLLARLVDDLLDLSRIEAGKVDLHNERFEPARSADEVVQMMEPLAEEKGLSLNYELDAGLGAVIGDEVRFKQVLVNLIGNAVKFTRSGEIVVRGKLMASGAGTQRVRFEVEDTGIGMTQEQLSRVFERFRQGDSSAARSYQGAGLGTTIAKYLVEMMGGTIGVASEPGKGSRFWFELSLPIAPAPVEALAQGPVASIPRADHAGPILLVEDNAINAMAIATILRKAGYRVDVAEDGPQALAAQGAANYVLVFLDMQLPGMDGPTVARLWREREQGEPTPIVALTANASVEDRDACLAAGMNDFLSKPVEISRLLSVVTAHKKAVNE